MNLCVQSPQRMWRLLRLQNQTHGGGVSPPTLLQNMKKAELLELMHAFLTSQEILRDSSTPENIFHLLGETSGTGDRPNDPWSFHYRDGALKKTCESISITAGQIRALFGGLLAHIEKTEVAEDLWESLEVPEGGDRPDWEWYRTMPVSNALIHRKDLDALVEMTQNRINKKQKA